ncbi:MAG: diguanylate cyclase [Candidatus Omnitrophota bacterium]
MNKLFNALTMTNRGIRYKMAMAFTLMSVIPMLVFGYLFLHYLFPRLSSFLHISLVFIFTILLMIAGYYFAKKIVYPVIKLSAHARGIADGNFDKRLDMPRDDEIGELGSTLNHLSLKLKENIRENTLLQHKTRELTVRDELTGLYNERYIRERLDEEIKRAVSYQRPCCFMMMEINHFVSLRATRDEKEADQLLKKIAQILLAATTPIDKVARLNETRFSVIFPEKNKKQCLEVTQNCRKDIARLVQSTSGWAGLSISAGISSTPLDGTTVAELIDQALSFMERAGNDGENSIIIS